MSFLINLVKSIAKYQDVRSLSNSFDIYPFNACEKNNESVFELSLRICAIYLEFFPKEKNLSIYSFTREIHLL